MGESATTVYVAEKSLERLEETLRVMARDEGLQTTIEIDLWSGKPGWVVLRPFPAAFFARPAASGARPWLAALTERLGCEGLHLELLDGAELVLLEANAAGAFRHSGMLGSSADLSFYEGFPVADENLSPSFALLEAPATLNELLLTGHPLEAVAAITKAYAGQARLGCPPHLPGDEDSARTIELRPESSTLGRVSHPKFGEGEVLRRVDGNPAKVTVRFAEGIKTLIEDRVTWTETPRRTS